MPGAARTRDRHDEGSSWIAGRPLVLEGVRVFRGTSPVIDGVDARFEPGRRYVIVGPSGSGKSTLLRLLNRLEDPSEGRILVGDRPLRDLPVRAVRRAVGLVFQAPRPLPGSVAGNLAYPFHVRGLPLPTTGQMAGWLDEVGLDRLWLDRDASGLSGGERQRLGLAVAVAAEPEVLALDEPTSALDPASARRIADFLAGRSRSTGLRTIAVTHHRGHALLLGDSAVAMDAGRVVAAGPVAEVLARIDADRDDAPAEAGAGS